MSYAELSALYASEDAVDEFIGITGLELFDIPRRAAFWAAKVFGRYRAAGGTTTGVLRVSSSGPMPLFSQSRS